MSTRNNLFIAGLFFVQYLIAQTPNKENYIKNEFQINIIPRPLYLRQSSGYFELDRNTVVVCKQLKQLKSATDLFTEKVQNISGIVLPVNSKGNKYIQFVLGRISSPNKEAYFITVKSDSIVIKANTAAGIFYGIQSLFQTLPAVRTNEPLQIPCMEIEDAPRFPWRGFMLDVSRHFYSADVIKEMLDLMATYKLNVFHWHLCDNQGWRIEIKKYPRLTSVGAWRKEKPGSIFYQSDSAINERAYNYGGYYTQQQIKEIIAFAAARNITVIPEIELPGHSGAAIAAYPEFSCTQQPQEVLRRSSWTREMRNKFSVEYCAGNDSVYSFLQDILKEVIQLFPSEYIHIGGDEVDKTHWKSCKKCQSRMLNEKIKDEKELQSYFVKRINSFLSANDKKLIGWDEILEGGLPAESTVMSWRGEKGGIAAAKQGHPVIMVPNNPLYLNRYQANPESEPLAEKFSINTMEKVYHYDPIPQQLTDAESKFILGSQIAIWTEFITTTEHLEYMLLPRLPAFAESVWTSKLNRNWEGFLKCLPTHFKAYEQKGIRYRRHETIHATN